jgi:hypothetical protein
MQSDRIGWRDARSDDSKRVPAVRRVNRMHSSKGNTHDSTHRFASHCRDCSTCRLQYHGRRRSGYFERRPRPDQFRRTSQVMHPKLGGLTTSERRRRHRSTLACHMGPAPSRDGPFFVPACARYTAPKTKRRPTAGGPPPCPSLPDPSPSRSYRLLIVRLLTAY